MRPMRQPSRQFPRSSFWRPEAFCVLFRCTGSNAKRNILNADSGACHPLRPKYQRPAGQAGRCRFPLPESHRAMMMIVIMQEDSMKLVCGATILAALSGCVPIATEENVEKMPMAELCTSIIVARNLGNSSSAVLAMSEIERRGQFSASELRHIRTNTVVPGMSEGAAICAWGNAYTDINVTTTAGGASKQYVYASEYRKTHYFYTENGRVTAVQL